MFTPYWKTLIVLTPGPQGGTNWQPSSYNPNTQHVLRLRAERHRRRHRGDRDAPAGGERRGGDEQIGSTLTVAGGFGSEPGHLHRDRRARRARSSGRSSWPESCYAGSTTTAGNLVFVGRTTGDLLAFDARTGKQLWSFQTGAGANNAPTIFQQDGKEYLAFYAGGNALAASPHGDDLWLFALDGTLGPAAGARQGPGHRARWRAARRARGRATPPRARPSSPPTARPATARPATAATAAPT